MNFYCIDPTVININSWDALLTALDIKAIIDLNIYQSDTINPFTCYNKVFNKIETKYCLDDYRPDSLDTLTPEERGKCYKKAIRTIFSPFVDLVIEKYQNVNSPQTKENWNILVLIKNTKTIENTIKYTAEHFFNRLGRKCDWGRKFNYKQIREYIDFYILHFKYRSNFRYSHQQQCFFYQRRYINDKHPNTEKFKTIDDLFKFIQDEFQISEINFYANPKICEWLTNVDHDYGFNFEDEFGFPERYYPKSKEDDKIFDYFILDDSKPDLKKYTEKESFNKKLFVIDSNEKYGFIDKTGKEVIPCIYDFAQPFSEGMAIVKRDDKYGFINTKGRGVIPCKYDYVESFKNGLAIVGRKVYTGTIRTAYYYWNYGCISREGEEICDGFDSIYPFSEGLALVGKNGKLGYIDETGKIIIPLQYEFAGAFSEGLALVVKDSKIGYIDKTETLIIPNIYDPIKIGVSTHIPIIYDAPIRTEIPQGREKMKLKFILRRSFQDGIAIVVLNKKVGCIDKNGQEVIPIVYDRISRQLADGIFIVGLNGKYGILNCKKKNIEVSFIYESVQLGDGVFFAKQNGKYGLIDKEGNNLSPFIYAETRFYTKDLFIVSVNNKWGILNIKGEEITSCIYDSIECLSKDEDSSIVRLKYKYGFIDAMGKEIIPCVYESVRNFSEGIADVKLNDKWSFIDKKGNSYSSKREAVMAIHSRVS
ncbi:WG repeat-containing protein [Dysgonomonas sp. 520]|uniref:WG repeat-containing protein n=1 Tax=Dysgonomonas sp. 520 TaxID=2302931 RepID=UPI0013D8D720|nr:WG repeat-containing protein [Dysgonomonas sp. 520]NDW09331.1 WG repeat-containing protein [Dysgonomonas sp. 520]